jgi:hypothetical protein
LQLTVVYKRKKKSFIPVQAFFTMTAAFAFAKIQQQAATI